MHKWWAQRLGSVFRAMLLATFSPSDADVLNLFCRPTRLDNAVVFDPFAGSGTMFNDRQLLCLSLLAERITAIPDKRLRFLFTCLFSGTLEFNNMFVSYKGEGTGAVRHMFSHHILKPERMPLEANPWGTPKSSGGFSNLFQSRVIRALAYCEKPFEIKMVRRGGKICSEKVYGLSCPLGHEVAHTFEEFRNGKSLYVSCGDSSTTDLLPECVDAVVTDPPFFDNVHLNQKCRWPLPSTKPSSRSI